MSDQDQASQLQEAERVVEAKLRRMANEQELERAVASLPTEVLQRLERLGIRYDDDAVKVAAIAYQSGRIDPLQEEWRAALAGFNEALKLVTNEETIRKMFSALRMVRKGIQRELPREKTSWYQWMAIAAGVASLLSLLASNFDSFISGLGKLLHLASIEIFSPAYAQAQAAIAPAGGSAVLPVAVNIFYYLLGIGYIASLLGMQFGTDPKSRANYWESVRMLTVFFIGAVTGKVA